MKAQHRSCMMPDSTCFSRAHKFSCMRFLFCSASSMAASLISAALAGRFLPDALALGGLVADAALGAFGDFGCFFPMQVYAISVSTL